MPSLGLRAGAQEIVHRPDGGLRAQLHQVAAAVPFRRLCQHLQLAWASLLRRLGQKLGVYRGGETVLQQDLPQDSDPRRRVWHRHPDLQSEAAQHSRVQVRLSVGGAQHQDREGPPAGQAIPQLHELRLHGCHSFVILGTPDAQYAVHLIQKDDGRRELIGQAEHSAHHLLCLPKPLALQRAGADRYERGPSLPCNCFGEHGLAGAWWAVQQDSIGLVQQARREVFRML
mmetsp:Transcript_12307/g.37029  ORF Transcript_12307/g.37029 Transcript_12307/m.37029 type:complete len:229 (-) Transcript_12307:575-1261(-)